MAHKIVLNMLNKTYKKKNSLRQAFTSKASASKMQLLLVGSGLVVHFSISFLIEQC